LERVQLHADLTMLARLGQALNRARETALACSSSERPDLSMASFHDEVSVCHH